MTQRVRRQDRRHGVRASTVARWRGGCATELPWGPQAGEVDIEESLPGPGSDIPGGLHQPAHRPDERHDVSGGGVRAHRAGCYGGNPRGSGGARAAGQGRRAPARLRHLRHDHQCRYPRGCRRHLLTLPLAVSIMVTLLVYWFAEEYAELLGERPPADMAGRSRGAGGQLADGQRFLRSAAVAGAGEAARRLARGRCQRRAGGGHRAADDPCGPQAGPLGCGAGSYFSSRRPPPRWAC
jgi:hypothetical protein